MRYIDVTLFLVILVETDTWYTVSRRILHRKFSQMGANVTTGICCKTMHALHIEIRGGLQRYNKSHL